LCVVQKNGAAGLGRHLGDAPAHRTRTDEASCVEYGLHMAAI